MSASGRRRPPRRPALTGLIIVLLVAVAAYLAFAKSIPFTGNGYELHATFNNAATLKPDSPVRIAGVTVGTVTDVQPKGTAADVTFTVDDEGRPIHSDAQIEIRPRLFLEGNFFLDVHPGSPEARELGSGDTIPVTQTSTAVQLDEVLTALQSNSRRDLQRLLSGYGTTLTYQPTPADDATQDPDVQGQTAAEAINQSFRYGGKAGKGTTIVNQALLGEHPNDLSGLIRAQGGLFGKLRSSETELQGLITNFNTTAGALASQSDDLSASIHQLAPTLAAGRPSLVKLNRSLPPVSALALALRPGLSELPGTIRAAHPWLHQANGLLREQELGGLARLISRTSPGLAHTADTSLELFPEITQLSRCASQVLEPAASARIKDQFTTGEPNWHELFYSTVNMSGESQSFDGNGSYLRLQSGGGPILTRAPNPDGADAPGLNTAVFGNAIFPPEGVQPVLPTNGTALDPPPFRTDVPCPRNPPPRVNGPASDPGPPSPRPIAP